MLIFYLAVVVAAMYWVVKTLAPEMAKPPQPRPSSSRSQKPAANPAAATESTLQRIERLEILLYEKNQNITLLQTELKTLHSQTRAFGKIKGVLEEEIHRLREQNRIFRSELGLPVTAAQPKETTVS